MTCCGVLAVVASVDAQLGLTVEFGSDFIWVRVSLLNTRSNVCLNFLEH